MIFFRIITLILIFLALFLPDIVSGKDPGDPDADPVNDGGLR